MQQASGGANPQVSRDELVRLAALFDAEGSVSLHCGQRPGYVEQLVVASITMSHEATVTWISDVVKRLGIKHFFQTQPPRNGGKRPQYLVRIASLRTIARLWEAIGPFMHTKAEEFGTAMDYVAFALAQAERFQPVRVATSRDALPKHDAAKAERHMKFEECKARLAALRSAYLRDYTRYSCRVIRPVR